MATSPQADLFRDGNSSCLSFSSDCGSDQSTKAPRFQGGNHELEDHQTEMKETEDMLAAEMNKLSVKERLKALHDVHCVGEVVIETPEMIEQSLREFDQIVQTTRTAEGIYNVAENQNRSYVEDPLLRLKFLRADMFNAKKSVNHMMNFLQQKALHFGEEKVAQDIVPEDMNTEEIALMQSGAFQILKDRDRFGRVILYHSPFRLFKQIMRIDNDELKIKTLVHVLYHIIFNVLIPMEDVQTKGIVVLYYEESKRDERPHPGFFTLQMKVDSFFFSLPFRVSSLHVCLYSSPETLTLFNKMCQVGLKAIPEHALRRTCIQYGSDMERQYKLRTFGIPLDNFPVDIAGNIQTNIQTTWCNEYLARRIRETDVLLGRGEMTQYHAGTESANPVHSFVEPTAKDVLLGRGKGNFQHPGNIRFREFLQAYQEQYNNTPRYKRVTSYTELTTILLQDGVRFLKTHESGDGWVETDFSEAEKTVKQVFRSQKKKTIS